MKNNLTLISRRGMLLRLSLALLLVSPLALLADPPTQTPTRVACVGDSITYGAGLKEGTYPEWLGRWLGSDYDVRNFGRSGATMLHKGDLPYIKQSQHDDALAFKPDVVVIMLGTNDSKHHGGGLAGTNDVHENWAYKEDYIPDYEALIAEFRAANPSAKIYICYPTPCFPGRWGIDDDTIHHEIIPLVQKVARKSKVKVIDLYSPFDGKKDMFPDTVHPNEDGAKMMAGIIYHVLTGKEAPANPS
jgi:acyl-CoA thioesterase I